jgi:hypothetical protein|tara:strand:+ start:764 stop:940 length:177 start_codon:yes stop_codon:yes gene_type:complete
MKKDMTESLRFVDEMIEKAEYDSYSESKKHGVRHETFYLFNLKVLKTLIKEESEKSSE